MSPSSLPYSLVRNLRKGFVRFLWNHPRLYE
eukprot:SAG11_NODE_21117_length_432_cov_0.483483_1_plen_30_part_10